MHCSPWCSALTVLLFFVSCGFGNEYSLEWTPAGVAAVNWEVTVDIGDKLILNCSSGSYSNIIGLRNSVELTRCNTSTGGELRGNCIGMPSRLFLNIEEASAKLPGDFGFEEGQDSYLTSFSTGADLSSAIGDTKSGGECLDNLRLTIHVRDSSSTSTSTTSKVDTSIATSTSSSPDSGIKPDGVTPFVDPNAEGLVSFDGSAGLHALPVLMLTCTLLTLILRIHS